MKCYPLPILVLFIIAIEVNRVQGHGRLVQPPSRASAWRYGFPTKEDYNDNESYCGGLTVQQQKNGGKCGVCGDPWHRPQPRLHEHGGMYGQSVIVKTYRMADDVQIGIDLSANHMGYFEFRLCVHNFKKSPETDECFNEHVLQRSDNQGTKYYPGPGSGMIFNTTYKLPSGLTCEQCVLQWQYFAGNNWGKCQDGTEKVGCGPQEQFRACADIRITEDGVADEVATATETGTNATLSASTTAKPRTRGTVTYRTRRPNKQSTTTPWSTTLSSPTKSSVETSEVDYAAGEDSGPYVGITVALASLLFAIASISVVILYFYRCHSGVKNFAFKHFHKNTNQLKPASVFTHYNPQLKVEDRVEKPPVPVRRQRPNNFISEPLDVVINGVPTPRIPSQLSEQSEA